MLKPRHTHTLADTEMAAVSKVFRLGIIVIYPEELDILVNYNDLTVTEPWNHG